MELVTEKDGAGESFYLRINGVPVFMKGANWIPLDSFLPQAGPDDYRRMLTAARDANMNMLRVWGGGIYENDIFYDLCDSLGIVVWQDFMYACAMYPVDQDFLADAGKEAKYNIIRLRNHPCVAMYCGNNECDEGWHNWGWQEKYSNRQQITLWNGYGKLFDSKLPTRIQSFNDKISKQVRPYLPSSPRYGRANPRSLTEGDAHYWGVWHDAEPFEVLEEKIPRFMSEFGFQSLPSMKTIEMFTSPGDRHLDSAAMLSHQKHSRGFKLIREYMERWYRVPEKFEDYIYVSQLLQAEGMRIGFEAQRRAMPYCMGTLYWQLNDCWPAVSWSSIDYSGQWKALHYTAKKAFAPVLVSTEIEDGRLDLYIVSDRLEETGGWMTMKLREFDSAVLWERTIAVKAPPNASVIIFSIPLDEVLAGVDRSAVVFSAEFICPGEDPPLAIRYFAHPKDMKLPDTGITFDIIPEGEKITLSLTADVLAKNVFLDLGECHFSDNFFDILPGETVTVTLDTDIPIENIKDGIRIRTLRDTY
jgi:beta-mannosidase